MHAPRSRFIRLLAPAALSLAAALGAAGPAAAQQAGSQSKSLQQLLEDVRAARQAQEQQSRKRVARFIEKVDEREAMLAEANSRLEKAQARRDQLQKQFDANEKQISELNTELDQRAGDFGEVFGVVRQVAGDVRSTIQSSLTSAQMNGRGDFLDGLAESKKLPAIGEIERLWTVMLEEMVASGEITRFDTDIVLPGGETEQTEVIRLGAFNAVAGERFLQYTPDTGQLSVLPRQPSGRWQSLAGNLANAGPGSGPVATAVDPSRGTILSLLIQKPNLWERVQQGKVVGYIVLAVGLLGLLIALERFFVLTRTERAMRQQRKNPDKPSERNPLGRVLSAYHANRDADVETLQLKLDEAIMQDAPALERGLSTIKILASVAPLLGLLGTVVGMIATFQAITLFGTGDPQLMAGGISQALITTVLGLIVAVPLILLHSLLSGRSRKLIQMLERQSSGVVAEHAEAARA